MNGFVNIIKPENMSSALAVMLIKKKIKKHYGKQTLGHMGTLDPMASGVLPMGINQANRLFDYLLDKQKTYIAEFSFGTETDTLDITGVVVKTCDKIPTIDEINKKISLLVGDIEQIPPKFSAKNIDGKRGYELARAGVDFELKPKTVTVLDFKCTRQIDEKTFEFAITCKGGTYVRSLCRDLAYLLGTVAVMSKLRRSACGVFTEQNAVLLQDFIDAENIENYIIKADEVVAFQKLKLNERQAKKLLNGVFTEQYEVSDGLYRIYTPEGFWGIGEVLEKVLKMKTYVRDI